MAVPYRNIGIIREGKMVEISDIKSLQQSNYKKVSLSAPTLSAQALQMPGVSNLVQENGNLNFFYKGDINAVLRALAGLQLSDVAIEAPTLEEIFMHYYE